MKYLNLVLVFMLVACNSSSADLSKIKVGMSGQEVTALVGKPDNQIVIFQTITHWHYGKSTVVLDENKVTNIVLDTEKTVNEIQTNLKNFKAAGIK